MSDQDVDMLDVRGSEEATAEARAEDADGKDGDADQRDIDPKAPSPGRLAGED